MNPSKSLVLKDQSTAPRVEQTTAQGSGLNVTNLIAVDVREVRKSEASSRTSLIEGLARSQRGANRASGMRTSAAKKLASVSWPLDLYQSFRLVSVQS